MSIDIIKELNLEQLREIFLKYTREAFQMLPKLDKPCILDIGCGTGIPTIELTRLSSGEVIGIDIDQDALEKLNKKIEMKGLSARVSTINCSLYKTDLPDKHFDILWDEGVIHILDLKKSLKECSRLLKPNGFLVMGEMIKWIKDKFGVFSNFGFKLINQVLLPEKCWWIEYYKPLEKRIQELRKKYPRSQNLEKLRQYEREVEMVKKNPMEFNCAFYIMQKVN